MRALIIDDQIFSRDLARRVLGTMGITKVQEFEDGGAALAALEETPALKPDLMLVDYEMAPMGGIEFVNTVRASGHAWSKVPILMITGHTSPEHVRQAQIAGVDGFIVKPFSLSGMRSRIEKVLKGRRGAPQEYVAV